MAGPGVRRITAFLIALLTWGSIGLSGGAGTASAATFSDIASSPFRAEIEWLAAEGVTTGCGRGRFCPRDPVSRGEMATFLVRLFGYTARPATDPFRDDNGLAHEPNINRLYAAGITSGCAPGLFCPTDIVTRGQMAAFLVRALNLRHGAGIDYFADDDGSSFERSLDRLFFANITRGCGHERACPKRSVTREQMAAFLHRSVFADPIGPAGFAQMVTHPTAIRVELVGPARFRGFSFSADGARATRIKGTGTIAPIASKADQTGLVNGVRFAHLTDGPLAGSWVKVIGDLTRGIGRAPAPPPCSYRDILTSRDGYKQHATTLLDTTYMLPSSYVPGDLVSTSGAGLNGGFRIRAVIRDDLAAMARAARGAGAPLQVVSAFRSYSQQAATFQHWVEVGGYQHALLTSARAGHSEHQLGTTLDVTHVGGRPGWEYTDWGTTAAGKWMATKAWKYGFVMTYPRGETAATCYAYEPWHYRYVGKAAAAVLRSSGLTLRESIWAAYGP